MLITSSLWAQMHEVGFFVGGSNYIGDVGNETFFKPNHLGGGIMYKRNLNSRISLRAAYSRMAIASDDADATNIVRKNRGYSFTNTINELSAGIEFNFFNYDLSTYTDTHTPYLLFELVAFNYSVAEREIAPNNYELGTKTSYAIPFGIGYKTKVFDHFAVAAEIKARYTFVDDLDYNNPQIPRLTFGNPDSNDWYVFTAVSIVYSFGRPPCFVAPKY
ncbi:MAG: DUF6089 family protein [Flavobacteriaceae bacterium]|nr:DUF6089 family protein [Flavobacteriaceae bacterium]